MPIAERNSATHAERHRDEHRHAAGDQRLVEPRGHRPHAVDRQLRIDLRDVLPHDVDQRLGIDRRADRQHEAAIGDLRCTGSSTCRPARMPDPGGSTWISFTTPTTVRNFVSGVIASTSFAFSGRYMRRPIGSRSGQNFRASRSSTMTTRGAVAVSPGVEVPAARERNLHRLEVAVAHDRLHRRDERLARLHLVALGEDDAAAEVAAERDDRRQARRLDARLGAERRRAADRKTPRAPPRPCRPTAAG